MKPQDSSPSPTDVCELCGHEFKDHASYNLSYRYCRKWLTVTDWTWDFSRAFTPKKPAQETVKHTAGPWRIANEYDYEIYGADSSLIATIEKADEYSEANAELIARAPQMAKEIDQLKFFIENESRRLAESVVELEQLRAEKERLAMKFAAWLIAEGWEVEQIGSSIGQYFNMSDPEDRYWTMPELFERYRAALGVDSKEQ